MLEGTHYQKAYVTRDIVKAVAAFTAQADVRKIIQFEGSNEVMTANGPGTQTNKFAFIWVGDLQYELIEPVSEFVAIFSPALPADDSLRFHHSCMRIDDWTDFRARVQQQPYPVVMEGDTDTLKFLYLDTRELLGHYVEYVWMTDERWTQLGGRER